jgi:peptidoglycan-N-acetylglucosamine deacetylase
MGAADGGGSGDGMSPDNTGTAWRLCYHSPVSRSSRKPMVSVSVDLDAVECYFRIYGLPGTPPESARFAVLRRCLPRFAELFARHDVRATFFVVGQDLEQDADGRRLLADLARAGHELANHSYTHPYHLVRLDRAAMGQEVDRAHDLVAGCAGSPPVGFRAPGYATTSTLVELLCERGYAYDSSAFPAVPYYLTKAAVVSALRLLGRRSGSMLDSPRVLLAPRSPYRPQAGAAYRRGDLPILELPMAVTPALRLPVYGTSLVLAPEWLRRRLVASALSTPFFNLELHGIDLADAGADGIPGALSDRQLDLRLPLARKLQALEATLRQARDAGAIFCTLREAASQLGNNHVASRS